MSSMRFAIWVVVGVACKKPAPVDETVPSNQA